MWVRMESLPAIGFAERQCRRGTILILVNTDFFSSFKSFIHLIYLFRSWRGGEAVNTAVCKTAMHRFESGSRLKIIMAGKEQIAPEGRFLINFTKAEMLVGLGITLIPGLGGIGALTFLLGGTEYLIIQFAKKQGEKNNLQ